MMDTYEYVAGSSFVKQTFLCIRIYWKSSLRPVKENVPEMNTMVVFGSWNYY